MLLFSPKWRRLREFSLTPSVLSLWYVLSIGCRKSLIRKVFGHLLPSTRFTSFQTEESMSGPAANFINNPVAFDAKKLVVSSAQPLGNCASSSAKFWYWRWWCSLPLSPPKMVAPCWASAFAFLFPASVTPNVQEPSATRQVSLLTHVTYPEPVHNS